MADTGSRMSGFFKLGRVERLEKLRRAAGLDQATIEHLGAQGALPFDLLDRLVENAIGGFTVPLGIATNMIVDGREVLVPMATEESSVIAAVGNAARMCRDTGGFQTSIDGAAMIAQVQLVSVADPWAARARILERREEIARLCNDCDPVLVRLGGGFRDVEVHVLDARSGPMVIVHLIVDTRDAMGANAVNTMAERLACHRDRP